MTISKCWEGTSRCWRPDDKKMGRRACWLPLMGNLSHHLHLPICFFVCVCVCMCVHATMEEAMGPKGAKRQKLTKWLTRLTACHTHTYPRTSSYTHNSQPCCGVFVFTLFCESCFRFPTRLETSAKNVSHIVNYFERKMMMMSVPAEIVIYEWQNIHRSAVPFAFRLLPACHGLFVKYDLIYWVWPP